MHGESSLDIVMLLWNLPSRACIKILDEGECRTYAHQNFHIWAPAIAHYISTMLRLHPAAQMSDFLFSSMFSFCSLMIFIFCHEWYLFWKSKSSFALCNSFFKQFHFLQILPLLQKWQPMKNQNMHWRSFWNCSSLLIKTSFSLTKMRRRKPNLDPLWRAKRLVETQAEQKMK